MATGTNSTGAPGDGAAITIDDIPFDVLTQALTLLEGPALAAASCASTRLFSLCSSPDLWRRLCLSTWPSLSHPRLLPLVSASPRSFFSDAYSFPTRSPAAVVDDDDDDDADLPDELISAVDIYHGGVPIFSRVIEMDTSTSWFRSCPFRIDALERKDPHPQVAAAAAVSPEELMLSWIVIDPARGRAVNISSRRAVAVERHWYTGDTVARFATVPAPAGGCAIAAVVTCQEGTGKVQEVGLVAEDMDGVWVSGREGLRAVAVAAVAERRGRGRGEEEAEAKERYLEFTRLKTKMKSRREWREGLLDLGCTTFGAAVSLALLFLLFFR